MSRFYTLPFTDIATGAAVGTYKTIAALITANTLGYRAWLRRIVINPAGEAPQDFNIDWQLIRTDNTSAGTAGTSPTPAPDDPLQLATILTAGVNYSVEPGNFDTVACGNGGFNGRGGYVDVFNFDEAIKWGKAQTLCLRMCAGAAVKISGMLQYAEY